MLLPDDNLRSELLRILDAVGSLGAGGGGGEERVGTAAIAATVGQRARPPRTTTHSHRAATNWTAVLRLITTGRRCRRRRLIWFLIQLIESLTSTRKVPRVLCA